MGTESYHLLQDMKLKILPNSKYLLPETVYFPRGEGGSPLGGSYQNFLPCVKSSFSGDPLVASTRELGTGAGLVSNPQPRRVPT